MTGAPASSVAPVAPPNGVGQASQAQTNGTGLTNAATPAVTIAPTTISPTSGFDGSQPLLDLAYGLPYGTPVAMGPNAVAPTPGTAGPSDFSFLEFNGQSVLVNVHSTQTANLAGLQQNLESQLGFTTTEVTTAQNMVTGWLPDKSDPEFAERGQLQLRDAGVQTDRECRQLPDGRRPRHPFRHLPRRQ